MPYAWQSGVDGHLRVLYFTRTGEARIAATISEDVENPWDDQQHEPERKLLGQCCSREFFRQLEDRKGHLFKL